MNVELLQKVKQHILAHPQRFLMSSFIETRETNHGNSYSEHGELREFDSCGTAACIAGWTCLLEYRQVDKVLKLDPETEAGQLLGIDEEGTFKLFFVASWPQEYAEPYWDSRDMNQRARIATARIDHFIATQGKE